MLHKVYGLALASTFLVACGGSDSNSEPNNQTNVLSEQKTMFSLGVSDAAVNNVAQVNLVFKEVVLQGATGTTTRFETLDESGNPQKVNLLAYQGSSTFELIADTEIDAGDYEWMRVTVVNGVEGEASEMRSHVVYEDESRAALAVKRKGNDGEGEIQINSVLVNQGENDYVLEFDLGKALVKTGNSSTVYLKPTAVRLENQALVFDISGTVTADLQTACIADNAALAPTVGGFKQVVYLYTQTEGELGDVQEEGSGPMATAVINQEGQFEIGFVPAGDYQIAYSCLGHLDDPESVDANFALYSTQTVSVSQDTQVTFSE
ncbi:DUF4382 domain-containing protein [Pseudoalteromonas rubra]|uniref:DUF4382 domain-containing protein n=1 Tax=Pseudoalteromonas rubra TaxID=43658 RepID=A0A0F4QS00_9GAMM|nr:DUF4382 domain-containing protein [Pseudoalteromonas rubra]KJZ10139.1 hypothetical protein TW77_07850 [Pseudoalteromonas rubra]